MVALVHKDKTNDMPEGFRNDKSLLASEESFLKLTNDTDASLAEGGWFRLAYYDYNYSSASQ